MNDIHKAENDYPEQAMEENFVGYLIGALEPEEAARVETFLRQHPDEERRLEVLREALSPLWDDPDADPPPGLAQRTVARVSHHWVNELPRAPKPAARLLAFPAALLRRADVLVAASLLILVGGLGITWVSHMRYLSGRTGCANDLNNIHTDLISDASISGKLLNVHTVAKPPRDRPGMVLLKLKSDGYVKNLKWQCPGAKNAAPPLTYEQAMKLPESDFNKQAGSLAPCYGYALGYFDENGVLHGPQLDAGTDQSHTILMADRPPDEPLLGKNSPNHGGKGQNVLFLDGSVKFCPDRFKSFKGDDLYLNKHNKVQAGLGWDDNVIGGSQARP